MPRKTYKTYGFSIKPHDFDKLSEEDLMKRFLTLVVLIVAILVGLAASVLFFGPKIGSVFGFLSVNRVEKKQVDTIAPVPPLFTNPPEATSKDSVDLTGSAEPNSKVQLFVNGPEQQSTTADLAGSFTFKGVKLISGSNTIFAKATDTSGNVSDPSNTISLVLDKDKPEITIDSLNDGDTVKNLDKRIMVTGSVNEKATITINKNLAVLKPDLTFSILLGVSEGEVQITIDAVDLAGNKSEKVLNVTYVKQSN
ncbi:MAG TPA: Ig-like domain-containing protein [Candidatus Saccharimonadales bacterium]|nr:Ig-like domain-containing protein [Candidatus Saccharimonadales bacterium]